MLSLAVILLMRAEHATFSDIGLVTGVTALANAVGQPLQGRLLDRLGHAPVLWPCAIAFPLSVMALGWAITHHAPMAGVVASAIATGVTAPSLSASMRLLWSRLLTTAEELHTAFAFESIAQEVIFISGPLLVTLIGGVISPVAPLGLAAGATVIGTIGFVTAPPSRAFRGSPPHVMHWLGPLVSPGVRTMLAITCCVALGFGAVEVTMPAFAESLGHARRAGLLLSLWGVGSMVGGILAGARRWTGSVERRHALLLVMLSVSFAALMFARSIVGMGVLVACAGLAIAPWISTGYLLIDRLAPKGTTTEASTWLLTGFSLGMAMGRAAAGGAIDAYGPRAGTTLAAVAVAAGAGVAMVAMRTLRAPDEAPIDAPIEPLIEPSIEPPLEPPIEPPIDPPIEPVLAD